MNIESSRVEREFRRRLLLAALVVSIAATASCTSTSQDNSLTLLAYDSFLVPEDAFDAFTEATGIRVEVALGGDAGELASKAALTAGNPEGDVLWGVDNALLTRLVEADVFDPYVSSKEPIAETLIAAGLGVVTPVDYGYVCVNYDIEYLADLGVSPPSNLQDLVEPEYRSMLAAPSAVSSSPGFAFLLATRAAFGEGWSRYWQQLVDNDVAIADGWTDAYYTRFTRHGGDRPMVVSYSTSPPAEVLFSDPPLPPGAPAPTGVASGTCFEQVEFAGVLRGTDQSDEAELLVDFLVSRSFQELLPESLFVYPANLEAELPESFVRYAAPVSDPLSMTPEEIADLRVDLLERWTRITGT